MDLIIFDIVRFCVYLPCAYNLLVIANWEELGTEFLIATALVILCMFWSNIIVGIKQHQHTWKMIRKIIGIDKPMVLCAFDIIVIDCDVLMMM